jgi:hypothetical protein
MRLFDDAPRTDAGRADYGEPYFNYLNRSGRPDIGRIRSVLEQWFERYPSDGQVDLRAAFQSDDEVQHKAASFELFLHELVVRLGCRAGLHPSIPLTSKRPDFLVESDDYPSFYLEGTVATGESRKSRGERARADIVYDALDNQLDSPYFFLSLEVAKVPSPQPSARKLAHAISRWLQTLELTVVTAQYREGDGLLSAPVLDYMDEGWQVRVRPIPKSSAAQGRPGLRPIGMRGPIEAEWVDNRTPVRDAIVDKARRYGRLDKPSVIAVNVLDKWSLEPSEVVEALFGDETFTIDPQNLATPRQGRAPNGAWTSASGPRYTRNSAVLVAHGLHPWNIGQSELRLYHNPWAERPYTSALTRLAQAIPGDGVIEWVDGIDVAELFGLPAGWPKEE